MEAEGKRALASAHEAIRAMTAGLKRGWNAT
jgi:hypothetical protein